MQKSFISQFGLMLQPLQLSTELKLSCFNKGVGNVFSISAMKKKKHVSIVLPMVYLLLLL
jgi:hypothetical protein